MIVKRNPVRLTPVAPMSVHFAVSVSLAALGIALLASAIWNERQMQRHRQPGITYRDVTLRMDGAWRRCDLFTAAGLVYQRRASAFGLAGVLCLLAALVAWMLLRGR